MKYFLTLCLLLMLSMAAFAVDDREVEYVGGTVEGVNAGIIGQLDTTSPTALIFNGGGSRFEIPYASITSYEYSTALRKKLGVAPAIAVGVVRKRKRKHFYRISYTNRAGTPEVAVFEVAKHMPRVITAVLHDRVPNGCAPNPRKDLICGPAS